MELAASDATNSNFNSSLHPAPIFPQYLRRESDLVAEAGSRQPDRPRVLIVGGSIGGCCAALTLRGIGCQVDIYERGNDAQLHGQGAGLVVQPDMGDFLEHFQIAHLDDLCIKSSGRQYLDRNGAVTGGDENSQLFSAWDVLHRAIKERVSCCYHPNSRVVSLAAAPGSGVSLRLESGEAHAGDLLVGADGPGSIVRSTFFPGVRSEYQGYVAWRGLLPEDAAPAAAVELLGGRKFTVFVARGFHILCYLVPGQRGEVAPGRRRINWVWYASTSPEELEGMVVDAAGRRHGHGVPRGALRPELAEERKRIAREVLPPALAELVESTDKIFFQAIHDLLAPSLVASGRVALVGDSGCILRPHTAAGTTKAAVNASVLARCLRASGPDVGAALEEYSAEMLELGRYLVQVGSALGQQSQNPGLG